MQSTGLLVLAATGRLDISTFLFANVGDDSEHPATLRYVREVAVPYAAAHGIALHELHRQRRDGSVETLFGRLTRDGSRSLPIPVRMSSGAPGTRSCTADFKIKVVGRWLRAHGASARTPAMVAVGISLDEIHRANSRKVEPYERLVYPLLDLRMRRTDCAATIRAAGLPVPPKSSCFFCPLHRAGAWTAMRHDEPDLFDRCVSLERTLNERRTMLGKDPVFLSRYGAPLDAVVPVGVVPLPFVEDEDGSGCDNGWCAA
ncbi:phosphoadenosine phosphosulfate reductase [Virgisporangium aliadipatigenens]|uniref:phosphoadenosine phosphosulfate reductase n=1 Tax=Virgisporangium aliadipatigenens TaxID=741659 RepID=UPI001EF169A7|nr:phosphoadenosine phosphosulfate reductase [Virgisporangium aliadipatigenens]